MPKLNTQLQPSARVTKVSFDGFPLEHNWGEDGENWLKWHTIPEENPFANTATTLERASDNSLKVSDRQYH